MSELAENKGNTKESVKVCEVSPRDGLQNIKSFIATEKKIELLNVLSKTGLKHIETTSFVSPRWLSQFSDSVEVLSGIERVPGVCYSALVPNLKGYEKTYESQVDEIAIFAAASEEFSTRNINCTIDESIKRFQAVMQAARRDNMKTRGYVSCVIECPYEGNIAADVVERVSCELLDLGCYEVSLGDTIGKGTKDSVRRLLDRLLTTIPASCLAGHFHDTEDKALDNIEVSLEYGLRTFDSGLGGIGGCPYALGSKGNIDTLSVATYLSQKGYDTYIDLASLKTQRDFLLSLIGNVR